MLQFLTCPFINLQGCGLVEFVRTEDATKAITTLNDTELDGRLIFVREDREGPRPFGNQRGGFVGRGGFGGYNGGFAIYGGGGGHGGFGNSYGGGGGGGGGGYAGGPAYGGFRGGYSGYGNRPPTRFDDSGRRLYVSNLPFSSTWQQLKDTFAEIGSIVRADILQTPDGRSRGSGVVIYESKESAQIAITRFNGHNFDGRQISVREDRYV
eukprot:TRINITY_DN1614_c0_g2_i3.p1 TRINITY_DN1614_c0_g2~~TRINITY_DN1614_c0_g2_i3.p1  ORF type:complete len:210 (+),score=48.54 TRINITY_DN1614_c0_g2_i3:294-923(+)